MKQIFILCAVLLSCSTYGQLRLDADNRLSLNHVGAPIGSASFTLSQETSGFGGMYVNGVGTSGALRPFYGYATNGLIKSYEFYDEFTESVIFNHLGVEKYRIYHDSTTLLNNYIAKQNFYFNKGLTVGEENDSKFTISENGNMLMNTSTQLNSFTDFTLNSKSQNSFGGMYINVNGNFAEPFYGYAVDGMDRAWTSYDNKDQSWQLAITQDENLNEVIKADFSQIRLNGNLLMNTSSPFNSLTDFTLQSKSINNFGGMYINVNGTFGTPFYGYAIDGNDRAWTSYDGLVNSWNLVISNPDPAQPGAKTMIQVDYDAVQLKEPAEFSKYLVLNSNGLGASGPVGTIYYFNGSFFGKTPSGIKQLDNLTNAAKSTDEELLTLRNENESLKAELALIKKQLNKIENMLNKM